MKIITMEIVMLLGELIISPMDYLYVYLNSTKLGQYLR